jgi:hypothetical protein
VKRLGLAVIVRGLGGELYDGGRRASVPGPGHGPSDRSVSLRLVGDRVLIHSFAGDDWRAVRDDLIGRGLVDRAGRLVGRYGRGQGGEDQLAKAARVRLAQRLWSDGRRLDGTAAERHLIGRGLAGPWPEALRSHPAAPAAIYRDEGPRRPALLAAIRDADGALSGVEVTYLTHLGARAPVRTPRKTVGGRPTGSAIRLAEPGPQLLVAEGVASALSASRLLASPAWALMSAGNLALWSPPPGVTAVVIAADRDAAGARAAWRLLRRLRQAGVSCRLCWPPRPHRDWNEALLAAAGSEAERGT